MSRINKISIVSWLSKQNILIRLILINLAVFLIARLVFLPFWLMNAAPSPIYYINKWLAIPSLLSSLLLKPWTIITSMFLHGDISHLFWNMLILYFSGSLFLRFFGFRKLLTTYIAGGIAGSLLFILSFNFFPVFEQVNYSAQALGASASVMAILIAIGTYAPNHTVSLFGLFEVQLKYIAIITLIVDLASISDGNSGGHIAHIGGAIFGYFFAKQWLKGKDITSWVGSSINFVVAIFKPSKRRKMKVKYKRASTEDYDYNARKKDEQAEVDTILEKISKSGYDSLSKKEKATLFKASGK